MDELGMSRLSQILGRQQALVVGVGFVFVLIWQGAGFLCLVHMSSVLTFLLIYCYRMMLPYADACHLLAVIIVAQAPSGNARETSCHRIPSEIHDIRHIMSYSRANKSW